ncbi:Isoleucyl-tRNA synthetase [Draconibacterium orientale]|uniref:Isoleucine--tRNA ligase n=1 Tax=Draconibacterium orientale TaxID=1168034 RepID=X5DGQ6_9BACT|nr:isoleucine--tRNA ligase [Draconibacterium orientale]AHW59637.1 isoleucyl-tRNA synthase [Draconibacterium orientale]SES81384.1 Isoleucyl-tRNA synthetase [Draconibacterium orientale]
MSNKFQEYKQLDLAQINKDVLARWENDDTFHKSITTREGHETFVFYEGPPSANGMPGIHHVMARAIKDIFCRYKTMKGFRVHRKAGWDTHGLPVELSVEKALNITKDDIGKKITVEEYSDACRKEVMKYTREWEELTRKMGYWVNMDDPYVTYDNQYIESVWWLLKQIYNKGLLYKGYTIQPYSPAAGTGLSSHELNQPGCYRDVKDTTAIAQFKATRNERSEFLFEGVETDLYFLAWTTTPWTLPSNTALCVGPNINYVKVRSFNPYTGDPVTLILAKDLFPVYFNSKNAELALEDYKPGDKNIPYQVMAEYTGEQLKGVQYEQLIDWVKPEGKAFEVITGDFVTIEDGTGIVHIAPTFGADDDRVAKQHGIAPLVVLDTEGKRQALVDKKGRFYPTIDLDPEFVEKYVNTETYHEFAGRSVKNEYDDKLEEDASTVDIDISVMLKQQNRAFKIEKHVHSYPHCWRTDKPVLYYPLDSWFIKSTAVKDKMVELNNTINWKPKSTGTGRFGNWLENLVDWNLSRSRFWGTPLPIWRTEDGSEEICIGSMEELMAEIDKAVAAGFMTENPFAEFKVGDYNKANYEKIDLHKSHVDNIILVSPSGQKMEREADLIDVWFDSGAMPFAQRHYPFEWKENFKDVFPADFIAEGVDQTRGWFFTLHAIATMIDESVAFKNIISNGLVLDKNGVKMSKRLGNAVDPFETIDKYGSDPLRWYMITNAQPWDNLKFDIEGVEEVKRKFFGTLYNTYNFFALYANVDGFNYAEEEIPMEQRPEIDRWIISLLNSLIKEVGESYENYEPTRAGRAISEFVSENLSNWFVRLSRKRYWGGEYSTDKISAYQTLYTCLEVVAKLMSPIAPFYADLLYNDLNKATGKAEDQSVHLVDFPAYTEALIDKDLEEKMAIAQKASSMILALRRKEKLKVRQPLAKIMVPVLNPHFKEQFEAVSNIILAEVNVKEVEFLTDTAGVIKKKIKPNFKALGPKYGKMMKQIAGAVNQLDQNAISAFESTGEFELTVGDEKVMLSLDDVEIQTEDIPGWTVATEGQMTIALDINLSEELKQEGIAREFINKIQNLRKENGFEVTDRIKLRIAKHEAYNVAVENHKEYICAQTLADELELADSVDSARSKEVEIDKEVQAQIVIEKLG